MAIDAIVLLERLRCITLKNTESRTEPYIWPVVIRVDDNTLASPDRVAVTAPVVGDARVVIKNSMRVGETADIPSSVGILRTRFEDNLTTRRLILVVALLEEDESPGSAVRAGFQAFMSELRAAIVENLFDLSGAEGEDLQQLINQITDRVRRRVKSAIENSLSTFEKAEILAGTLNLDDAIASAFTSFGKPVLVPAPITLTFESTARVVLGIVATQKYEIHGQLQLRPVVVDRCQAQVNEVNAARAIADDIKHRISQLKEGLRDAPAAEKPIIQSEIAELREEELPAAQLALDNARRALSICRARAAVTFSDRAEQTKA
jgi:hypothetical protein